MGGIHKAERPSKSQPAKQCGFTRAKPSRMFSTRRRVRFARNLLRQRDPQCGSKAAATVAADREGSEIERDVQRSPARAARATAASLVISVSAAASTLGGAKPPASLARRPPGFPGAVPRLVDLTSRPI